MASNNNSAQSTDNLDKLSDSDLIALAKQNNIPIPPAKATTDDLDRMSDSELLSVAQKEGINVPAANAKSGYEGIPDEQLNLLQKTERGAENLGLIKPGMEAFSPAANRERKLALETAANTATLGYLPQIAGGASKLTGGDYLKSRDEMTNELAQAKGGTKATGVALGLLPSLAIPAAAPAETVGGNVVKQGLIGGTTGLLSNPGDTEGEINKTQILPRLGNAAKGAALGGLLGAVGAPAEASENTANLRALKQSGAMLRDLRSLDQTGQLESAGKTLLDEGVVTPTSTLDDIEKKTGELKEKYGNQITDIENGIDGIIGNLSPEQKTGITNVLPNAQRMAEGIEQNVLSKVQNSVALEDYVPQVEKYVERLKAMPDEPLTFGQARKIKTDFDKIINWDKEGTVGKELAKQVRGVINGEIENSMDQIGEQASLPLYENWKNAKDKFGIMTKVNDIASDKLFRDASNRFISPSDYASGLGTLMSVAAGHQGIGPQEIAAGIAAGTANHLLRKYGNAVGASSAYAAAKAMSTPAGQIASNVAQKAVIPGTAGLLQNK